MRFLPFEEPDPSFVPLAGRRALDRAGQKLSLRAWQAMPLEVREALVAIGDEDDVDVDRARALLADAEPPAVAFDPLPDADPEHPPEGLADALGPERPIDAAWRRLRAVERYALAHYHRRGRIDTLRAVYDALLSTSSGESQSSR